MQITPKLNSDQTFMSESNVDLMKEYFPVFNRMQEAGYDVDFYLVDSFGGITIVPSTKRIRIKLNTNLLPDFDYVCGIVTRMEEWYDDRENKKGFSEGKKIRKDFRKP